MKRLLYILFGIVIISSCSKSNQIEITGNINNAEGKELQFSELLISGNQDIEKTKLDKRGNFKFKSNTDFPRFYNLSISKNNFLTLLIEPGEKVKIEANASNMSHAQISGSKGSLLVQNINNQLANTKHKLDSITKYVESIKGTEKFDQEIDEINQTYADIVNRQRDSSIAFIINNLNSLASIVALYQKYDDKNYVLYKNRDLQYIKIVSDALAKKYPDSPHVKYLLADKDNLFKKYNQLKTNKQLSELTKDKKLLSVPEVYLPNQSGDSISLNAVHAKYILLSFWASWSQESVEQNINLLDVYKKYHTKGFEIYQVSLDTKKESWIKAINFDQLPWINVIDLNGRTSYFARLYNVRKLPTSFLINPEGEIVSVNPTKAQLLSTFEYALK